MFGHGVEAEFECGVEVAISSDSSSDRAIAPLNPFSSADVAAILQERSWLSAPPTPEQSLWCERAASMLGSHASDRAALADLLGWIFHYNAQELLQQTASHLVLARYGARAVVRELALRLLDGAPLTSDRFKEIVTELKEVLDVRGPELFHPLRLALTGRAGQGELDRVILLLDDAANLAFAVPVKSARVRIAEFCAALD